MMRRIMEERSEIWPAAGAKATATSESYDAQPESIRLNAEAHAHAQIRETWIVLREIGIGDVIEKGRQVGTPCEASTEIKLFIG